MKKTILIFGSLAVALLLLFQLQKWSLYALGGPDPFYLAAFGLLFSALGVLLSRYVYVRSERRRRKFRKSSLSQQELRVLHLMADGLSNKEISEQLFIAETTVKSHVSKILSKLDAKRRTQAVKIGKELEII